MSTVTLEVGGNAVPWPLSVKGIGLHKKKLKKKNDCLNVSICRKINYFSYKSKGVMDQILFNACPCGEYWSVYGLFLSYCSEWSGSQSTEVTVELRWDASTAWSLLISKQQTCAWRTGHELVTFGCVRISGFCESFRVMKCCWVSNTISFIVATFQYSDFSLDL